MEWNKTKEDRALLEYRASTKACPKCGSESYKYYTSQTSMEGSLIDTGECTCARCGDKHQKHERVSELITQ